jgi:hypothetical protein
MSEQEKPKQLTGKEKYLKAIENTKQRAISLIDTHGMDVKFIVPNDPYIFEEIVSPALTIDEGLALAYQLEHRVIDSKDLKKLKDEYFKVAESIKKLEENLLEQISKANPRNIRNLALKRKVQFFKQEKEKDVK